MHKLEPTDEQLQAVADLPANQPVVMVNLLKFRAESADGDGTGWDAYQRYSKEVIGLIKERGGDILWAGQAQGIALGTNEDGDWDYVAMVRYPDRAAFVDMVTSRDYATANHHRLNGLERHTIIASKETFSRLG